MECKQFSYPKYNTTHKYDLAWINEIYLDSSFTMDDKSLSNNGYNLIWTDNSASLMRSGVCIFLY